MEFKTPVRFTTYDDLEDSDGVVILGLDGAPYQETQKYIIETFENDARWRFLMEVFANESGPAALALNDAGRSMEARSDDFEAGKFAQMIDLARAKFAVRAK